MTDALPTIAQAKDHARRLREKLATDGTPIGHGKSLELIAHQHGFRDWNTFQAARADSPQIGWTVGERVTGTYMGHAISGEVRTVAMLKAGWFRLELHLDRPVDVVDFDSFSNLRRRIRGVVGPKGHSVERTSDGTPHLTIDL